MRFYLLVAAIIAALGALAACGGDDGVEMTPTPSVSQPAASPLAANEVRITYYGHSMFTIESPGGVTILTDPNEGIGYAGPRGEIDAVTVSHDDVDHNKVDVAPGARVLRGLVGGEWSQIDETIGDVRVRAVASYHDDQAGAERGKNAIFIFRIGALTIVHAGDLGHVPSSLALQDPTLIPQIMDADVLLLPVGGHFTIGPQEADLSIEELTPSLVIPMHYRTDFLHDLPDADELATVDDFTAGKRNVLRPRRSDVLVVAGPLEPTAIMVLEPQPE